MAMTFLITKIILGGYWLMFAPALFLPLGQFFSARRHGAESLNIWCSC